MRLAPYDPDRDLEIEKVVTPLASLQVGRDRQLRLSIVRSTRAASIELRTYLRDGRRGFRPAGAPFYVFAEQLPDLIAALSGLDLTTGPAPTAD